MKMNSKGKSWKIIFIRITCWIGAILDFVIALAFTIYAFAPDDTFINTIFGYATINDMNYAIIAMENALMFAWTIILIWVDREPIKKRIFLAITAFAVAGILLFNVIGYIQNNPFIPIFSVVIGTIILLLFTISFILAHQIAKKQDKLVEAI